MAQFPTEPFLREALGRPVARAMACFVLYRKISQNRMPMPSDEVRHNFLPNHALERFWDALWLELWLVYVSSQNIVEVCVDDRKRS